MPRPRPPHLQRGVSRHNKRYWFVQMKRGAPKIRIPDELVFGTEEFDAAYQVAVTRAPKAKTPEIKASKGTLEWAWIIYKQSGSWQSKSKATQRQRENIMKHVIANAGGSTPISDINDAAIQDGVDRRSKTPSQAKNFAQMMRQFFKWLVKNKIVGKNPCEGLELPKRPKTGGFKEWTEDEIVKYETRWPIGTRQRVMLDVYAYTGLRRGDAARVGKQHISRQTVKEMDEQTGEMVEVIKETITLTTEKSQGGTVVHLPLLPILKRTLEAGPTGDLAFVCTQSGRPFVKESLGNAFKDACVAAGVLDKSAHGLRKAAATRAADNGATTHELMAIFGWIDIKEAEIYTRNANRKRLAARAMGMLDNRQATKT
jgi:integrase